MMVGMTVHQEWPHRSLDFLFFTVYHSKSFRWDFDRSTYPESVVSQFSLVCGNDYWRSLAQVSWSILFPDLNCSCFSKNLELDSLSLLWPWHLASFPSGQPLSGEICQNCEHSRGEAELDFHCLWPGFLHFIVDNFQHLLSFKCSLFVVCWPIHIFIAFFKQSICHNNNWWKTIWSNFMKDNTLWMLVVVSCYAYLLKYIVQDGGGGGGLILFIYE